MLTETKDNVVSYPTVLKVKNDDLSLQPGMTGTAEIATATRENVLLVPNAALRFTPAAAKSQQGRGFVGSLMPGPPREGPKTNKSTQKGAQQQVCVLRSGQLTPVEVKVGVSNGRLTEITGGDLQEGSQVVTEVIALTK